MSSPGHQGREKPLKAAETADLLAQSIRNVLGAIHSGDLSASAATTYRLEGALVALEVVQGVDVAEIIARLITNDPLL